jgi:ABC-2 type transport system permease protein
MFRGLWRLTWLETKIFVREPLGVLGTVGVPVLVFVVLARTLGSRVGGGGGGVTRTFSLDLPILAALLMAASAVMSLVTIVAIYREGGILKRLRATPLRPATILLAHVLVKLLFTMLTLGALVLAGRRYVPAGIEAPWVSFALALLVSTFSILSLGFVIASLVPTARFAQPVAALLVYPMLGLSGLFGPVDALPPLLRGFALLQPFTYAVSLLRGVWRGEGWMAHLGDLAALSIIFVVCAAVASKVFRWE